MLEIHKNGEPYFTTYGKLDSYTDRALVVIEYHGLRGPGDRPTKTKILHDLSVCFSRKSDEPEFTDYFALSYPAIKGWDEYYTVLIEKSKDDFHSRPYFDEIRGYENMPGRKIIRIPGSQLRSEFKRQRHLLKINAPYKNGE